MQSTLSRSTASYASTPAVTAYSRAGGVGVGVHYPPNHTQPAFAAWYTPLPATEQVAQQVLSLPFHPALDPSAIGHVISELERALP